MPGRVITFTSGKGGVGKTTVTANLAAALAQSGAKVTAIDTDIGLRNLDIALGMENRIQYDLVDVIEGRCHLRQALIPDRRFANLHLLAASQTHDKDTISPQDMVAVCAELKKSNDFVLIDCPAGIEMGFRNAVAGADEVVVVTTPEVTAVRAADRVIGLLESMGRGPGRLIINRIKPAVVKRGDMLEPFELIEFLAIDLLGVIPEDEAVLAATNAGLPLSLEAKTMAGLAFRNVASRLQGHSIPFLPLFEVEDSWVARLRRKLRIAPRGQV